MRASLRIPTGESIVTIMRPLLAVSAVSLTLLLAGCGGDGETADGTEAPPSGQAVGTPLTGSVGPGFEISLTAGGDPVTALAPGTYPLEVSDASAIHNFRLTGPGVDVATGVADEGAESFDVTVEPGTYRFFCDPHASTMNGAFEVPG